MVYIIEEHAYLYVDLGMAIAFGSSSSINGSDETLGCKSLPLSCVCLIKDGTFIFCHIAQSLPSNCELTLEMPPHIH